MTRDTVVHGVPSFAVDFTVEQTVWALDVRMSYGDSTAGSDLSGQERGTAYIAVAQPVLVGLSLSGTMSGEWRSENESTSYELVVPERLEYTRMVELVGGL